MLIRACRFCQQTTDAKEARGQAAADLLVEGLRYSARDLEVMYQGKNEGSESLASCELRHNAALLAVARGSSALVMTMHAQCVDFVERLSDAGLNGWDCSGGIPFFFDFDEDDGEDGGSGSLPLVDVPTRARAEGMLSAMSKAEELQEWQ